VVYLSFKEMVEGEFNSFQKIMNEDWTDNLVSTKTGECDLCGKKEEKLTEHHIVPRRLLNKLDQRVSRFFEKQKYSVCKSCHEEFHPENRWYNFILTMKERFDEDAKAIDEETNKKIEEKNEEVSKYKQDYNNIKTKLEVVEKNYELSRTNLAESKKEISILRADSNKLKQELEKKTGKLSVELGDTEKEASLAEETRALMGHWILLNNDKEMYKERLKKAVEKSMDEFMERFNRLSERELKPKFNREFSNIILFPLNDEDMGVLDEKMREVAELSGEIIVKTFESKFSKAN